MDEVDIIFRRGDIDYVARTDYNGRDNAGENEPV
jgi:hypothetical protein